MKKFSIFNFQLSNKKGFTLVEMLAVVFISSLIVLAAYSIYLVNNKVYKRVYASAELAQNARISMERITRDLRQAMDVLTVLPTDPESGTPATEIKFQDGHRYLDNNTVQYITYYLSGTDLHRKYSHYAFSSSPNVWVLHSATDISGNPPTEYQDSDQVKAENISVLQFWGSVNEVTVFLTVAKGSTNYSFQTSTYLRNI